MDRASWIVIGVAALIIVLLAGLLLLIVAGAGIYCFVLQPGACFAAPQATGAGSSAITGGTTVSGNVASGSGTAATKTPANNGGTAAAPAEDSATEPAAAPEPEPQAELTAAKDIKISDSKYLCDGGTKMLKSIEIENNGSSTLKVSGTLKVLASASGSEDSTEGEGKFNIAANDNAIVNLVSDISGGRALRVGSASNVTIRVVFPDNTYVTGLVSTTATDC
ncbi:MAG: hypothetical protein V1676_05235 [Candidatus Diapherotrites archaeon]